MRVRQIEQIIVSEADVVHRLTVADKVRQQGLGKCAGASLTVSPTRSSIDSVCANAAKDSMMISIDLSKTTNTKVVEFGIAQESVIDDSGNPVTHHFSALAYEGPGEFVPTERYVVDADLTMEEIAAKVMLLQVMR